nr:Cleavage and polyadenylation specificity factor subunit like [Ipomoea batatas]
MEISHRTRGREHYQVSDKVTSIYWWPLMLLLVVLIWLLIGTILESFVRPAVLITDAYNALSNQPSRCQRDQEFLGNQESVRERTLMEEHARDTFENLLFSVFWFRELTGSYPQNITVRPFVIYLF